MDSTSVVMSHVRNVLGLPLHLTDEYVRIEDLMSESSYTYEGEEDSQSTYVKILVCY